MANQFVNVKVPDRLNLDLSPSQLEDNEAADLYNMLVHEPGQLRRRHGYTRVVSFTGALPSPGTEAPHQIVTAPSVFSGSGTSINNTRAIVTFVNNQDATTYQYWRADPNGVLPSGYSLPIGGNIQGVFINADNPAAVTSTAVLGLAGIITGILPFSQQTMYDNCAIWTGIGSSGVGSQVIKWAGTNTAGTNVWVTINNGATTGTIWTNAGGTVPPASSLVGQFIILSPGSSTDYNYLITSHVAGASAFTIQKPYGLGQPTSVVPNKVLGAFVSSAFATPPSAPLNVQCAIVHKERVFVGRPSLAAAVGVYPIGNYPNAIAWSDAGEPEKWTSTNFIVLDGNPGDAVMGFGLAGGNLAIFKRYRTYLLRGSDETSFTVDLISGSIGCLDSRSITQYGTGCYFMSDRGMMFFDGNSITDVTEMAFMTSSLSRSLMPRPGHGIRAGLQAPGTFFTTQSPRSQQVTTVLPNLDYLLVTAQENRSTVANDGDSYMQYIPTGAWTRWGGSLNYTQPFVYTKPGLHLNNKPMALTRTSLVDLSSVVELEFPSTQSRWDQYYDTAGVAQTADVLATVQFKDFELFNGDTGRLHQLFVEHNCMYFGASDAAMVGWNVTVAVDPDIDTLTAVGAVTPRWVGNVAESAAIYQKYFTTQFLDSFPLEGSMFRIKLTTVGTAQTTHRPQSSKLFQVRALVEKTTDGRVDNAVTS